MRNLTLLALSFFIILIATIAMADKICVLKEGTYAIDVSDGQYTVIQTTADLYVMLGTAVTKNTAAKINGILDCEDSYFESIPEVWAYDWNNSYYVYRKCDSDLHTMIVRDVDIESCLK